MVEYERDYFTGAVYNPYWDFPQHVIRANKIVSMAHPKTLLEVGCAYGYTVKHLRELGVDAWGCDISEWCEQQAARIIPGKFVRCSADYLPFPDHCFDVVYCEGVLEHLNEWQVIRALSEFGRVGKQSILQVSVPEDSKASETTEGHICCKPYEWWFQNMPNHSWLLKGPTGTDGGAFWLYKG